MYNFDMTGKGISQPTYIGNITLHKAYKFENYFDCGLLFMSETTVIVSQFICIYRAIDECWNILPYITQNKILPV